MDPYDAPGNPDRHHLRRLVSRISLDTTRSCIPCRSAQLVCHGEQPVCAMCCLREIRRQCCYEDGRPAYVDTDDRSARQRGDTSAASVNTAAQMELRMWDVDTLPELSAVSESGPHHIQSEAGTVDNLVVRSKMTQLLHELLMSDDLESPQLGTISQSLELLTPKFKSVIRKIKRLAAEGCHAVVADMLDNFCMNSISRPSRLHTSLFHTLRQICTEYSYLPNSLFLPPQTITGMSNDPQAHGGYADIYKARRYGSRDDLCVKAVRIYDQDKSGARMKSICKEALLWRHLSHPNITPFYGMLTQFNGRYVMGMTCKWMPNGHIMEFIERSQNARRLPLLLDAAYGLQYLHSEVDIVHGDIKGRNILVDEHGHACLADFGLSTVLYRTDTLNIATRVGNFQSTLRWMAPELHNPEIFGLEDATPTRECDIYSFSMTMWEVFTGQVPYPDVHLDGQIIQKIMDGKRPPLPTPEVAGPLGLSPAVWAMMQACWRHVPRERPPIAHVVKTITSLPSSPQNMSPTTFRSNNPEYMYVSLIHENINFYASWNPSRPVRIGDYGHLQSDYSFAVEGNIFDTALPVTFNIAPYEPAASPEEVKCIVSRHVNEVGKNGTSELCVGTCLKC